MRWYTTLLLPALSIFIGFDVNAQYESIFGVSSTEWIFEWHNLDFGGQDTVYVEKDTMVNSIEWKKILVKSNQSAYSGGLLREDTNTGKVWYKGLSFYGEPKDTLELLSFDFSLEINDSFDISNMYEGSTPLYSKVISTYFIDGIKYIEFEDNLFSGFPFIESYVFIEGIGGIMGVLWKQYFGGLQAQYLLCSYKDGVKTTYLNKRHNGKCDLISSADFNLNAKSNIVVYPNPTENYVSIENKTGIVFDKAQLVNSLGKVKRFLSVPNCIDLTDSPPGIYTLQLILKSGAMNCYSIIKL